LADAPAKASGLAKFAALHADKFGRIELILLDGNAAKTLDLTDEIVRNRVRGVKLPDQLKQLFEQPRAWNPWQLVGTWGRTVRSVAVLRLNPTGKDLTVQALPEWKLSGRG